MLDYIAKSPILTVSGYIIGVIGLLFSVYTYQAQKQSGQIFYSSDSRLIYYPTETRIPYENLLQEKFRGKGQIHISQLSIWNGGNLSFDPNNQRTPVTISGDSNVSIFDIEIIATKTLVNDNFFLQRLSDGKYQMGWKVFDPDDGLRIQMVHSGSPKSLSIDGKFAPNFKLERWSPAFYIFPGFMTLAVVLALMHIQLYYAVTRELIVRHCGWFAGPAKIIYSISGLILSMLLSLYIFYSIVSYSGGISPFGIGFEGKGGINLDG